MAEAKPLTSRSIALLAFIDAAGDEWLKASEIAQATGMTWQKARYPLITLYARGRIMRRISENATFYRKI